ncbi:MAG TPA: tetratricopeptide repeat protein [Nitrospiria bacterium]|nr:tetratricopeptide repeat protein [Nitrospiria bacterium]
MFKRNLQQKRFKKIASVMNIRGEKSLPLLPVLLAAFTIFPAFAGYLHAGTPPRTGTAGLELAIENLRVSILEHEEAMPSLGPGGDSSGDQWVFAEQLLQNGLPSRAIPVLERLVAGNENERDTRRAWEALQRAYYDQGEYQRSLGAFFKIAINREETLAPGAVLLAGNSYLEIGEYGPAVQLLKQVPKDDRLYPFALYSLGLAGIRSAQERSEVLKPLKKLIRRDSEGDRLLEDLINRARLTAGRYLGNQGAYSDSVAMFATVDPASRYRPAALYGMGTAFISMKDRIKALVVFEELARDFPVSPYGLEASVRIGRCFARLNAYRTSVDRYRNAIRVLTDEKTFLEDMNLKVKNKEPISAEVLYPRFFSGEGDVGLANRVSWSEGIHELRELRVRLSRIEADVKAGTVTGKRVSGVKKTRKELDAVFARVLTGRIDNRISWIEDLIQDGTLQVAKNIVLIESYDPSP